MAQISAALKPRSILMATDFSDVSEKALRHALALTRFYGSKFSLAHVVCSLGLNMSGPDAIAACEEATLRELADLKAHLIRVGALTAIQHRFVVRHGELWPELREIIREESTDLVVVGTHGRQGVSKLFFGSVAEEIFRQAGCPVLIVGPNSSEDSWIRTPSRGRTFLLATDFGTASLGGFSQAIAAASHFEAKLVLLNVIPSVRRDDHELYERDDSRELRQAAYEKSMTRLAELARNAKLEIAPECHIMFESETSISELILETAKTLRADLVMIGLHSSAQTKVISRWIATTAYDVICHATSPVLTLNASGKIDTGQNAPEIPVLPLPDPDLIRIRGLGARW